VSESGRLPDQRHEVDGPGPTRLERLVSRAGAVLAWERIWPALVPPLSVGILFLGASWAGLWLELTPQGRMAGVALFGLATLLSLAPALRFMRPGRAEKLSRIDRDSARPHRIASGLDDSLSAGSADPAARALWEAHRARLAAALDSARVAPPAPRLARRDPYGLRFAPVLLAVAAFFAAGPERTGRLVAAFDWREPPLAEVADAFRLDGWIDPPAYTRSPPLVVQLSEAGGEAKPLRTPVSGALVLRTVGAPDIAFGATEGLEEQVQARDAAVPAASGSAPAARAASVTERRWKIIGDGRVEVRRGDRVLGHVVISAIPDLPPTIEVAEPFQQNVRGTFTLGYRGTDDYGIASAEARFSDPLMRGKPLTSEKPLVPAPKLVLQPPAADGKTVARTTGDFSAHPWAGARVTMRLAATDDLGQEGLSEPVAVTLPQRPFTKPLAKALVEQRRNLVLAPLQRGRVAEALHALMIEPSLFTPRASEYLGLRTAVSRLSTARTDEDLLALADYLWEMALAIEDGDLSDSERALRQAQEALRQALERGASDEEIRRLTQDLRNALDRFLRDFAERMMREQRERPNQQAERQTGEMRTLTPDDLKSLLDRLEEAARNGDMADAQRMLETLQQILENLQTARPNQGGDRQSREMGEAMNELDDMIREQQKLRDETFREGQRRRNEMRQGQRQQQGQRGQRGQRGQEGQQGEGMEGEEGEDEAGNGRQGQRQARPGGQGEGEGFGSLGERQRQLRQRLEALQRRMRGMGMNPEQGLGDAEGDMRSAEGAIGRESDQDAVDSQGRALENMRRGAQGMAQQMQQQGDGTEMGEGEGDEPGPGGQPGRRSNRADRDPLGRQPPEWNSDEDREGARGTFNSGGVAGEGNAAVRARRVLEELRRRLSDPLRPQQELDYLERLLRMR
jgi:uncharacterized protein (TIGR02302 family)